MDNNPDAASCQPKILSWHKRNYFEHAGAAGGFIDKYGYPFCRGRIFHVIEEDKGQYDSTTDIFWSTGACMIVRSDAWRKCFGFDADFFAHMEEIDLCWRFHKAGYRVCFQHESSVFHAGGGALPYSSPFKTYLNFRNNLFLLYKNLPENKLRIILFIRKLMDGIAAFVLLFNGKFVHIKAIWKAHMDYYKSISALKEKREKVKELSERDSTGMIMNKSIVFEFYIKGKKTFNRLKTKN
jgi:GT2 family glycosyltransferase